MIPISNYNNILLSSLGKSLKSKKSRRSSLKTEVLLSVDRNVHYTENFNKLGLKTGTLVMKTIDYWAIHVSEVENSDKASAYTFYSINVYPLTDAFEAEKSTLQSIEVPKIVLNYFNLINVTLSSDSRVVSVFEISYMLSFSYKFYNIHCDE